MSKASPTIMVVEDEELLLRAITQKLKLSKFDVISVLSYVNNFSGNHGHLAKLQQLHPLQGKQKIKSTSHIVSCRHYLLQFYTMV